MKSLSLFAAAVLFCLAMPAVASAQSYRGYHPVTSNYVDSLDRPRVSPYLNLLNNQNITTYQRLVRPLVDERQAQFESAAKLNQLGNQLQQTQRAVARTDGALRTTGHPTRFMNLSHYYSSGRGGAR